MQQARRRNPVLCMLLRRATLGPQNALQPHYNSQLERLADPVGSWFATYRPTNLHWLWVCMQAVAKTGRIYRASPCGNHKRREALKEVVNKGPSLAIYRRSFH